MPRYAAVIICKDGPVICSWHKTHYAAVVSALKCEMDCLDKHQIWEVRKYKIKRPR